MIGVQVSSNQSTDNLCFVKEVKREMSKHTSKQTVNIGTIPKTKWEKIEGKETYSDLAVVTTCIDKWQKPI